MDNSSTSFSTIVSNNLEEVRFIAGTTVELNFYLYKSEGSELTTYTSCSLIIFRYGEPKGEDIITLAPSATNGNMVRFIIPSELTKNKSGVYQQQILVRDAANVLYIPAQGKIIMFPGGAN